MSKIKIEKGIKIPNPRRASKYPFDGLMVGDSFFTKKAPKNKNGTYVNICGPRNVRYAPKRFVQRAMDGGLRVWRVE